ncbi:MAG: outer membrane beta-barrel protein [Gemmatimonadales bacterium]|nr:outer membrane beta-barrel protein [Gemmatimonadales bacterium]
MGYRVGAGLLLAATLLGASPVAAQARIDVGGFGGGSFPTNEVADLYKIGYTFGGTVRYRPPRSALGVQLDGLYMTHANEPENRFDGGMDIYGLSLGANWAAELDVSPVAPFLLVGLGVYNIAPQFERTNEEYGTQTKVGINFGGGVEWRHRSSRFSPFIDFRFIGIFGSDPREGAYLLMTAGARYVIGGKKIWW